jgi:hypothetical protein
MIAINLAAHLNTQMLISDYDTAAMVIPRLCRTISEAYAEAQGIEHHEELLMAEIFWAGWSRQDERMKVLQFCNYSDFEPEEAPQRDGRWAKVIPDLPQDYVPAGLANQPASVQATRLLLALRQHNEDHAEEGLPPIGGYVVVTEVTPTAIQSAVTHKFEDAEQMFHASSATLARLERGDLVVDVGQGLYAVAESLADELEQVEPAPPAAAVTPMAAGLSRAERRRLAQEQRKEAKRAARAA